MHILVVDDNPDIVELMQSLLESGGYDVSTTSGGNSCLEILSKEEFDIILLDITMPDVSGFDVVQKLNDLKRLEKNKVILFTAASISDSELDKWKEIGVKACLRKPFDPGTLFQIISDVSMKE